MRKKTPISVLRLPLLIVVLLVIITFPVILKLRSRHAQVQDVNALPQTKRTMNPELLVGDPFNEVPNVIARAPLNDEVRIITKFVETGSHTDELSFDWLVPFAESTAEE